MKADLPVNVITRLLEKVMIISYPKGGRTLCAAGFEFQQTTIDFALNYPPERVSPLFG